MVGGGWWPGPVSGGSRVAGRAGRRRTSWSRARAAPPAAGAAWRPRWWRAPQAWGGTGPACRPSRARRRQAASAARARRDAVLCPRRDASSATPPGGLFNNAGRANGARPPTDVSAPIDRAAAPAAAARPRVSARHAAPLRLAASSGPTPARALLVVAPHTTWVLPFTNK